MPRVPQVIEAWVIPDVPGVKVWAEIEAAIAAGVPVVLSVEQAKRVVADRKFLESEAYKFTRE